MTNPCPYCGSTASTLDSTRRPDQDVHQCTACSLFFVVNPLTHAVFFLGTPADKTSLPQVNRPK